uniref:Uncharacterized protein n=1 Tax=Amphimedon queenslandica TaxID=400682 RepID=A0A1X7SV35_AMPQE
FLMMNEMQRLDLLLDSDGHARTVPLIGMLPAVVSLKAHGWLLPAVGPSYLYPATIPGSFLKGHNGLDKQILCFYATTCFLKFPPFFGGHAHLMTGLINWGPRGNNGYDSKSCTSGCLKSSKRLVSSRQMIKVWTIQNVMKVY